jgi:hypothetical protein
MRVKKQKSPVARYANQGSGYKEVQNGITVHIGTLSSAAWQS